MTLDDAIKKMFLESSSDENFFELIEKMKIKADKGLLESSVEEIDNSVNRFINHKGELDKITEEVDYLLENYKEE